MEKQVFSQRFSYFTGFLIAVLNYDFEEKEECEKPTNFTIKVSGVTNRLHEGIIVKCEYIRLTDSVEGGYLLMI